MQLELSKEQEHKLSLFRRGDRKKQTPQPNRIQKYPTFFNDQIADCVLALKACKKNLQNKVVDCGSGAGLPSIVWAILEPEKVFYSIDKK